MPRSRPTQSRVAAGVPTGGQFASTSRPEATGIELADDDREHIIEALLDIERLGANNAERYAQIGRVAAALPSAARSVVGEVLDDHWRSLHDDNTAVIEQLAEIALRRAATRAGTENGQIDPLLTGLSKQAMKTDLERAARYHVRQALRSEDCGDPTWVCPVDPSHATLDGRCITCGASKVANTSSTETAPPPDPAEGEAASSRAKHRIDPADIDWTACGDPDEPGGEDAQLLGTVTIGQTPFHVLALQVEDDDKVQTALQRDEDLAAAMEALGDQSPYETVEIDGRAYVLLLSPHAR